MATPGDSGDRRGLAEGRAEPLTWQGQHNEGTERACMARAPHVHPSLHRWRCLWKCFPQPAGHQDMASQAQEMETEHSAAHIAS